MPSFHSIPVGPDSAPGNLINNLNIKHVGTGGNAGAGAYRFWYDDNSVLSPAGGSMTINVVDAQTAVPARYFVYSYTTTSPRISAPKPPESKSATVIDFALDLMPHELAFLSIVVWDKQADVLFGCDPQVGNDPET